MLSWAIADLAGHEIASIEQRDVGANVVWPLAGHRTASVTTSLYDAAAYVLAAQPFRGCLSTVLRVAYDEVPVFSGVIVPSYQSSGKLTINAFAASWRLEHLFLHADTGDITNDQGELIYDLVDRVRPTPADLAAGIPVLPIARGNLTLTRSRTKAWNEGSAAWSNIDTLQQLFDGPELDWRPLHTDGDPVYCALDIAKRIGVDRTTDVVFSDGEADQNATIDLEPGGQETINYATALGQTSDEAAAPRQTSEWPDGEHAVGRYETWIGSSDTSETAVLKAQAQQQVMAYGAPPEFVRISPAIEHAAEGEWARWPSARRGYQVAPHIVSDFAVGDTVTAAARVGALELEIPVRIRQAALREIDAAGNVASELEAVPQVFRAGVT